jgi:hypothetical protein
MFAHFLLQGEPLGLEYIAAGVETRHRVKILDMAIDKLLRQLDTKTKTRLISIG